MKKTPNDNEFAKLLAEKQLDSANAHLAGIIDSASAGDVEKAIAADCGRYSLKRLATMLSPMAENYLESMAQKSMQITRQRFGSTVQLYAPLYVSNYCVNSCSYCAFSTQSSPDRIRLSIARACAEADIIAGEGFRHILLVSGEDSKFIDVDYLVKLAERLRSKFSSISIEIYPMSSSDYAKLFTAGIDGIAVYQETYDRSDYAKFHQAGPKSDFDWRLSTLSRAGQAGFRSLGLGFLIGLSDWRTQTLAMAEHADFLMKRYWQGRISFSFPRMRPAENVAQEMFGHMVTDSQLSQIMMALRLCFPDSEIVLSTRESANFRDNMSRICVTRVSAGSKTNPGGYGTEQGALKQFEIDDDRDAKDVAAALKAKGLEAVWKDWDSAFAK
ncbi:MAG: 2-iminoacetate synthase ThiH [Anaerohalosphaeraceae bacterium]|nr:2-iminoacetate synthase ThiH [Anaerohalosphaeraceae bacterium]